ncbi:MAG: hypothetical protein H7X93_00315 [Sphingomonadaceae bacterium]|nr:hypothetical protein [Sphingomonadaceae bacterium]
MPTVGILGRDVEVKFMKGEGGTGDADRDQLVAGIKSMAALIDRTDWPDVYRDAFGRMKGITFFDGMIRVNGHQIERPCCDEDDAVFYWEIEEFMQNQDDDVRANTFFHDCWHVVQFHDAGFPDGDKERVWREVDATTHQIIVAKLLGCSDHETLHLEKFKNDQKAIIDRLNEGVRKKWGPQDHHVERKAKPVDD